MTRAMLPAVLASAIGLAACSPTFNWREVRPEGSDAVAMFPCKPERFARPVRLAGVAVEMRLSSCAVDGVVFGLSHAAMDDPSRVRQALQELRDAAARNIGAMAGTPSPFSVAGMTPNELAQRWALQGHAADGKPVVEQVAVFTRGLRVYQATIVGPMIDKEAAETFFSGIRLSP